MDDVARLASKDRSDLFRAAAEQLSVTPVIIEKDFWVCWMLRRLYAVPDLPAEIHLKGGTSLSKVFAVIERMSENIDLVIDRNDLGFTGDKDPAAPGLSGKTRQRLVDQIKDASHTFVREELMPRLDAAITGFFGREDASTSWSLAMNDDDDPTLLFSYPTIEPPSRYLRKEVRLELGARGDPRPSVTGTVHPYAADIFPTQFKDADVAMPRVVAAERTYWEKATMLHRLHHRAESKPLGKRQSRHYYDLFRLSNHDAGRRALEDIQLLRDVVDHKMLFYPCGWAQYPLATPGSLHLVPPDHRLRGLRVDYNQMGEEMMFGDVPGFDDVLQGLHDVEADFNRRENR